MSLNEIHREPTGQVAWYQAEDRYFKILHQRFGQRFLDYRQRWQETSERGDPGDFPLSLDLAINSGCQLSCVMCPLAGRPRHRQKRLMDGRLFDRLLAQAAEHGLAALTFGLASEPLLHPQAPAWVDRAAQAGVMDIRLGSNGLALGEETALALIDSGLTRLEISLDAVKPESFRAIRGASLETLERAVERFLELRQKAGQATPLLRLSFLKLSFNEGELEPFLERWQGRADLISIQEPIWFPGSRLARPEKPGRPLAPVCAQSWQRLGVDYDGHIWPCCSWYGEDLLPFNGAQDDLAQVWRSAEMEGLRQFLVAQGSGSQLSAQGAGQGVTNLPALNLGGLSCLKCEF